MIEEFNCGKRLRELRNSLGWEQKDLAQKLGVEQPSISKDERSHTLTLSKIKKYCVIFNIPLWKYFTPDSPQYMPLEDEEKRWLELYRRFPIDVKTLLFNNVNNTLAIAKYVYDHQSKFTGSFD